MPCVKKKLANFSEDEGDNIKFSDFLKTLTLEDFLRYPKTRYYLEDQHDLEFDYLPRERFKDLYKKMCSHAQASRCNILHSPAAAGARTNWF